LNLPSELAVTVSALVLGKTGSAEPLTATGAGHDLRSVLHVLPTLYTFRHSLTPSSL